MIYTTKGARKRAAGRRATVLLLASLMSIAALVVTLAMLPPAARLDEYLCPVGAPLAGHTILLIDKTDFPSVQQREALRSWIAQLKDEIRPGERLSIRLITDNPEDATKPIFARCNPGDGSGVSRLWGNPDKSKKLWTESYEKPLDKALETLLKDQETKTSPIIASIEFVMWDKLFGAQVPSRRLIVLSDLVENVSDHNQ